MFLLLSLQALQLFRPQLPRPNSHQTGLLPPILLLLSLQALQLYRPQLPRLNSHQTGLPPPILLLLSIQALQLYCPQLPRLNSQQTGLLPPILLLLSLQALQVLGHLEYLPHRNPRVRIFCVHVDANTYLRNRLFKMPRWLLAFLSAVLCMKVQTV